MSLSVQEPEAAGSSGSKGWVKKIVKLELESCGRVSAGSQGCEKKKTSSLQKLGVPVHFRKMKGNSIQVSNLHINMQGRHWGYNFFCLCPAARSNSTRIITECKEKKKKKRRRRNCMFESLEQKGRLMVCNRFVCVRTDHRWAIGIESRMVILAEKTNWEWRWILDEAIPLEMNAGAETWRPEEWYVTTLPPPAL